MSPEADVEAIESRLILEAVYQRYGYDLRGYSEAPMRRRIDAVLTRTRLPDRGALQHRLLADPEFFAEVLEDLTVRVSEMFRDPAFYRSFRALVLPTLRTYPVIRIWHAGCATGEEAYASAVLLTEEGLHDRAQLYATDMSVRALEQAKQGVYAADKLAQFADNYQKAGGARELGSYFSEAYDRIAIRAALRRNVSFFQHNLVTDHVFGEMQVVFCRNVLIYFGAELRERVLARLAESLCANGFLCLGAGERLSPADKRLGFASLDDAHGIYRRAP